MVWEIVINAAVAAGTLALATATFLSLHELKQQRLANYIPHISSFAVFRPPYVAGTNIDIAVKNYGFGLAKNVIALITNNEGKTIATIKAPFIDKGEDRSLMIDYRNFPARECVVRIQYSDLLDRSYQEKVIKLTLP